MRREQRASTAGAEQQLRGERGHAPERHFPKAEVEAYQARRNATSRSEQRQARKQEHARLAEQDSGQTTTNRTERGTSQYRSGSSGSGKADSPGHQARDRSRDSTEQRRQSNPDAPSAPMSRTERRRARKAEHRELGAKEAAKADGAHHDKADGYETSGARKGQDATKRPEPAASSDRTKSSTGSKDLAQPVDRTVTSTASSEQSAGRPDRDTDNNARDGERDRDERSERTTELEKKPAESNASKPPDSKVTSRADGRSRDEAIDLEAGVKSDGSVKSRGGGDGSGDEQPRNGNDLQQTKGKPKFGADTPRPPKEMVDSIPGLKADGTFKYDPRSGGPDRTAILRMMYFQTHGKDGYIPAGGGDRGEPEGRQGSSDSTASKGDAVQVAGIKTWGDDVSQAPHDLPGRKNEDADWKADYGEPWGSISDTFGARVVDQDSDEKSRAEKAREETVRQADNVAGGLAEVGKITAKGLGQRVQPTGSEAVHVYPDAPSGAKKVDDGVVAEPTAAILFTLGFLADAAGKIASKRRKSGSDGSD